MSELPELMPLEWIEPKRLNSNVMKGDRYENTKRDIELHGIQEKLRLIPKDVYTGDPEQPHDRYVIEDGNQRYKIAQELGIEAVPYEIVERPEAESLAQNYRHQANRGEQDPLVEAQMFEFYHRGRTQEQVVEELGLSSRSYLTDRLALLDLSEEARDVITDFRKTVEYRVRARMYGEDEETVKGLIDEIVARATISLRQLRPISTLPEDDQMQVLNAMLDTFIEGGTVSKRQVEDIVKDIKERNEKLKRFNKAWMDAVVKNCPTCNFPPLLTSWDEENHTFRCATGHTWRYDKTLQEVAEEEEAERQRLKEEQTLKDLEEEAKAKEHDTKIIKDIIGDYSEPPTLTLPDLFRHFYSLSPYSDFGQAKAAVFQYLNDHPDVHLAQPPTQEELNQKRLEEEKARQQYLEDKLTRDMNHLDRITYLYRDALTTKQLYTDYMELSRTISPQDGRDIISLYLERHPEVTFPGDEPVKVKGIPESVNRAISAAIGQPLAPDEEAYRNETTEPKPAPKRGNVYYTIKVEEIEVGTYARDSLGSKYGYSYDTGQGGGAGPIGDRDSFPDTVDRMVREIWKVSRTMKSYPRPTMKNTVVDVCLSAADEGLITEAEIWNALITYPLNEAEEDHRPKGDLCDGCTEDCDECPHEDEENDEELEQEPADDLVEIEMEDQKPPHLELEITAAALHIRLAPWILGNVAELSDIKSIRIEGLRDKEEVLLEYQEPDKKGRAKFSYSVQTTTPIGEGVRHIDTWKWLGFETRQLPGGLEVTSGKYTATREDLDTIFRFIDETVYTDLNPWDDPNTVMGPTEFTMTPVDSKDEGASEEPTIPVPDHGRGYQEEAPVDMDPGEEHHEHYEVKEQPPKEEATEAKALSTCPKCGKQSPNSHYCTSCGHLFTNQEEATQEPEEAVAHGLSENEEKWLDTGVKKLGPLAHKLTLEEAKYLRDHDTRKGAQNHLVNRISELKLASAPTPELTKEADE